MSEQFQFHLNAVMEAFNPCCERRRRKEEQLSLLLKILPNQKIRSS